MQDVSRGSQTIRFGTFELDASAGELRKQGVRIRLQEQPLRILQMLLAKPGQPVSREELRSVLWPTNTFVDFDHGLNRAINKLREALGDSAESPRFIETLAKRGYRFVCETSAADARQLRSLLVLPFDNLSGDPEQEYFTLGLTDALTVNLAKIGALRVISRTTAMYYKRVQKPLPEIARELQVDGVIEGSAIRGEGRVRVSAQLLHAPTDTHLWAENYERDVRDILVLQAEMASSIVREIQVKVTSHEQSHLDRMPAIDPAAYDDWLRGRYYWSKRTAEGFRRAIHSFEQAIARDPRYMAAYAGLADCYTLRAFYCLAPAEEGGAKAKKLALQAMELDPVAVEAHTSLAWALQLYDYDFVRAESEYRRAVTLDSRYPLAHYWLSMNLSWMGRAGEAIAEAKQAVELDPLSPVGNPILAHAYHCSGQYELAVSNSLRTIELFPSYAVSHWQLGWAYLEMSQYQLAITALSRAMELDSTTLYRSLLAEAYALAGDGDGAQQMLGTLLRDSEREYVPPYMIARIYAALDQKDEALRWLETAYRERAAWMPYLKVDPRMRTLRMERRCEDLLRRLDLLPVLAQ
jgi:TolB-like protein/Flp pilus assembly protein TadD